MNEIDDRVAKLNRLFGSYRAEWLREKVFELFAEPSYFTALKDNRPCVLVGGRGTGKTTVLKGLSYSGQYALCNDDIESFNQNNFIGIYFKVNTNHVRSFIGEELSEYEWGRVFGHYFNLVISFKIIEFVNWYNQRVNSNIEYNALGFDLFMKSLGIEENCDSFECVETILKQELIGFQHQVNNVNEVKFNLSVSGTPIEVLTEHLRTLKGFKDKLFYIIIDEYENFENYQQQIINTLIKHNPDSYTFKIGVRELGWRIKHTLNKDEMLHDPADYVLIDLNKKNRDNHFANFAKEVCEQRINLLFDNDKKYSITDSLGSLSIEEEANLLNVQNTDHFRSYMKVEKKIRSQLDSFSDLYKYFISYWAFWHKMIIEDAINDSISNPTEWKTRFDNYKYELVFKIRKGRGKSGIQKYYSGWSTYVNLANGNIRYLMELVYQAYVKHLQNGNLISSQVSHKIQTESAIEVGEKNLMELEGLWKNGAQLTKLLLGLGRVFNVFSSSEGTSAPEKNQFFFDPEEELSDRSKEIIAAAVMNLALIRIPGNKSSSTSSTRDYLFTLHPIYSPFFIFSYRRKRKITLHESDLLGLVDKTKTSISAIIKRHGIEQGKEAVPNQLLMFESYYND